MFPIGTRDAVGNTTSAIMDYRVLQPSMVTDSNRNRVAIAFVSMGMVAGTASLGKPSDNVGDNLDAFKADLSQARLDQFFATPTTSDAAGCWNHKNKVVIVCAA
jgi:hypothetical protein